MYIKSEKELYKHMLAPAARRFHAEIFVWGEELVDKKLIIYPKKLKDMEGYHALKSQLQPCGLVLIEPAKATPLHCVLATVHTETGNVYFSEEAFNGAWKVLRNSIYKGVKMERSKGNCSVSRPEDIVVLDCLMRTGSVPVIEKHRIRYVPKELTEEERFRNSRKQSMLDNPKMLYFYADDGKYFHDKECVDVKEIPPDRFCASEDIPEKEICPKCRRKIYFRKACYPNVKQSVICDKIFKDRQVSIGKINHFIMEAGMKLHATGLDEILVEGREDTWIVKGLRDAELELWHNNYVRTSPTERYITSGYHRQKTEAHTFIQMLNYIERYSFAKHLEHENAEKDVEREKITAALTVKQEGIGEGDTKKIPWYIRLWRFFRRIF